MSELNAAPTTDRLSWTKDAAGVLTSGGGRFTVTPPAHKANTRGYELRDGGTLVMKGTQKACRAGAELLLPPPAAAVTEEEVDALLASVPLLSDEERIQLMAQPDPSAPEAVTEVAEAVALPADPAPVTEEVELTPAAAPAPKVVTAGKDGYGARLGTNVAKINAALTAEPQTVVQLARAAGLYPDTTWPHLKKLAAAGKITRTDAGYRLNG